MWGTVGGERGVERGGETDLKVGGLGRGLWDSWESEQDVTG